MMSHQTEPEQGQPGVNAGPPPTAWQNFLRHRSPVHNVNVEHAQSLSRIERLALWITDHVGTMSFFFAILTWTILWLSWNFFAPKSLQFDPPTAFVLWLFISNMIQILLMPLIMVGQNLQGRHAELRAESDYEVNVRADKEIAVLLTLLQQQQETLDAMAAHLGIEAPVAPGILAQISAAGKPAAESETEPKS